MSQASSPNSFSSGAKERKNESFALEKSFDVVSYVVNPNPSIGRIFPRTPGGADTNPLPGEPMPPQTSIVKQKQNPTAPRSM